MKLSKLNIFAKETVVEDTPAQKREKILNDKTSFAVREAYKALRTNVMFSIPKKNCKRLIVTSANASEGKSTNSLNLAITIAETGARVLLIDCDLHRPNVANLLELKKDSGLSNILAGYKTLSETIVKGVRGKLDVLPAGEIPPNPTELLGSAEFSSLLDTLSESYEYIILDTSPVNPVTDAVLLSEQVDGIVLVVRCNQTEKEPLNDAVNSLKMVNAKILGFILNDSEPQGKSYGKYSRYSKYSYEYSSN